MIFVCVAGTPSKFPRLSTIQNHPRPLSWKLPARRQNKSQKMNINIRWGHRHIGSAAAPVSTPLPFELPCLPCKLPMAGTHDDRRHEHSGRRGRSQRDSAADTDVTSAPPSSRGRGVRQELSKIKLGRSSRIVRAMLSTSSLKHDFDHLLPHHPLRHHL